MSDHGAHVLASPREAGDVSLESAYMQGTAFRGAPQLGPMDYYLFSGAATRQHEAVSGWLAEATQRWGTAAVVVPAPVIVVPAITGEDITDLEAAMRMRLPLSAEAAKAADEDLEAARRLLVTDEGWGAGQTL